MKMKINKELILLVLFFILCIFVFFFFKLNNTLKNVVKIQSEDKLESFRSGGNLTCGGGR